MGKCEFCNLTKEDEKFLFFENSYWKIYLADKQDYIGRCIVVSKIHYESLSDLPLDNWVDLKKIINSLESIFKKILGAAMFNWSCLMNNAYKEINPSPHLHFHFRPRYKNSVKIQDCKFCDEEFGRHYMNSKEAKMSEEHQMILFEQIKKVVTNYLG